jgi:hypothetical protein
MKVLAQQEEIYFASEIELSSSLVRNMEMSGFRLKLN